MLTYLLESNCFGTFLDADKTLHFQETDRRYDSEPRVEGSGDVIVDWML